MDLIIGVSLAGKTWTYVWLNKDTYNKYELKAVYYFPGYIQWWIYVRAARA